MINRTARVCVPAAIALGLACLMAVSALGEDWPAYRHDSGRSGVTGETLKTPLKQLWRHTPAPPQPAWTRPAKWDAYHGAKELPPMRDFDTVYYVTAAGSSVTYGSSADDGVHCLDAATGKERWAFVTEGPVRLPPTWHDGKVYFGSDDGCAYCVDGSSGRLIWKYKAAGDEPKIPSNGKLISPQPIRTGVIVADGRAYFGASLVPWADSYLCAVDAATGSDKAAGCYKVKLGGVTFQGAMLANKDRLFLMQGRAVPLFYSRPDGQGAGGIPGSKGQGGVHAVLTDDGIFAYGPGSRQRYVFVHNAGGGKMFDIPGARRILITPTATFVHHFGFLVAQDWSSFRQADNPGKPTAREIWKIKSAEVHDMIRAGDVLFAGGDESVVAYDVANGSELWQAPVTGKARGLAVADGRLFVSTTDGSIYCFAQGN